MPDQHSFYEETDMDEQKIIQNIPRHILESIVEKRYIGRVDHANGVGQIKGPCGDEIEFSVSISDDVINNIKFMTTGCFFTYACGTMTADLVMGKKVHEALSLSPAEVMDELKGLPKNHCHCAILSVSTLFQAIANFLLES